MANIEDRIVRMEFDNAAFERKLAGTIRSLGQLDAAMKFPNAGSGLTQVSDAASKFHLSGMTTAISSVSAGFLAMSTIAVTALSTIVSKAISAGAEIVKALAINPVMDGFAEYELNMRSIQTILSNTTQDNTNLEQVNAALDQLNEYSDKTIYNFGEMARNIGTFTAAGVDLDTSVQSIKGIANLAAISGSTSEQASTAMYQLSQAISTGTLRLVDWNSVVNAGMGGEVFQRALFETGVAMGTLTDVPVGTTFEEWTEAGNTFRGSLEDEWLTSDVLTQTLSNFTGELSAAQLQAIGYTEEQARYFEQLGITGVEAATKVRTLTQVFQTAKESVGSGWSKSFRIVFGDFEQATNLFTRLSEGIGGFIGRSADARNELLQQWADMGGRERLIYGIQGAFKALGMIMRPITQAFREIFPKRTATDLLEMTKSFQRFVVALQPSTETVGNLRRIFRGFFAALSIGWTVLKEGVGFIKDLIQSMTGLGGGGFLSWLADLIGPISNLQATLVKSGGIAEWFDNLAISLEGPIAGLKAAKTAIVNFFKGLTLPKGSLPGLDRFSERLSGLGAIGKGLAKLWEPLKNALGGVADILNEALEMVTDWFSNLGGEMAAAASPGDYDAAVDTLNVGLLGGIGAVLLAFLKNGSLFNIGGGIFDSISGAFDQLTGTLKAMQLSIKADALMKIAIAIGVLTASVLVLSLIDSDALTKALTAMAVGFGQLIAAFALLNKIGAGPRAAAKMNAIATSLILLAGAVLVLSLAMKVFSTMSWEELAKGLAGIAGSLLLLVGAAYALQGVSGGMLRIGVGLMAVAIALGIMAGVVKLFSMMDWSEMAKGLVGVAGALTALAIGMHLMPKGMILQGAGLLLVGTSLLIIQKALKMFAQMEWDEMGRGLAAMGGALTVIAAAVYFMPPSLPLIGAGLILVAIALKKIADVLAQFGEMEWDNIARGLVAMGGALLAITIASVAASNGLAGAAAIYIMAQALQVLVEVITVLGGLTWGTIAKGLIAIAGAFAVLGLAALVLTPVLPSLLLLGAALVLIGAGFALFGVGVAALAKGFKELAQSAAAGVKAFLDATGEIVKALPDILAGIASGILEFIGAILDGVPVLIEQLGVIIEQILVTLTDLIPELGDLIRTLGMELINTARSLYPQLIRAGFELITALLTGIRDNIGPIVTIVADIIVNFLDALSLKIPEVIDAMVRFWIAVVKGTVEKLVDIGKEFGPMALAMIQGLVDKLKEAAPSIGAFFQSLPGLILGWIGSALGWLAQTGIDLIEGLYQAAKGWLETTVIPFLQALPGNALTWVGSTLLTLAIRGKGLIQGLWNGIDEIMDDKVIPFLKDLPSKAIEWVGSTLMTLLIRGKGLITGLYNGIDEIMQDKVIPFLKGLPAKVFGWVGSTARTLFGRGYNLIVGLYNGAIEIINSHVIPYMKGLPTKIFDWIGTVGNTLRMKGWYLLAGLYNGAVAIINELIIPWFGGLGDKILSWIPNLGSTLLSVGREVIQGLWDGLQEKWDEVTGWLSNLNPANHFNDINLAKGHAKENLVPTGVMTMAGLQTGMMEGWEQVTSWLTTLDPSDSMNKDLTGRMTEVVGQMVDQLSGLDEFAPVITPVLDLTQVQNDARSIAGMLATDAAYISATRIAASPLPGATQPPIEQPTAGEVKFEQNIYAPAQLSTGDIYRNTRNQIALAKEELSIP